MRQYRGEKLNSALSPRSLLSLLAMFLAAFQLPTSRMDEGTLLVYPRAGFEGKTAVPCDSETFYGPPNPFLLAVVYL